MTEQTAGSQDTATTQTTTTDTGSTQDTGQTTTQQTTQQTQQRGTVVETQAFPPNWREQWAGDDSKELKRLQRFTDPSAVYKWNREMEKWKSSAKLMPELPEKATPEQLSEYRKAMGVPEEATKYYDGIKDLVIGENERPVVNEFLSEMHNANAPQSAVNAALKAFYTIQEKQQSADIDAQKLFRQEQEDHLRQVWGQDFRSNVNAVRNLFSGMPDGLKEGLESWVDHNGNLLMNNADFLQWIGSVARENNPAGIVVPGGNGDQMASIDAKLAEFSAMRKKDINAWSRNETAQAEERRYLEAKEKIGARM